MTAAVSAEELEQVTRTRVFFGHQSVGANVLDGVPAVFTAHGVATPAVLESRTAPARAGGSITHALIGTNEDPLGKIKDFDSIMRGGMAEQVDVAMMKLCYIDIRSDSDVDALFTAYRDTLAALQGDYPGVRFVAVTVPLTTEPSVKTRVKSLVKRDDRFGRAENVRRERLNALLRREYGDGRLFDIAAVESTAPDGSRSRGSHQGEDYYSLYGGYAADLGHVNEDGARRAATAWLRVVGAAAGR